MTPPITHIPKPGVTKKAAVTEYKKMGRPKTTGQVRFTKSFTTDKEEERILNEITEHLACGGRPNRANAVNTCLAWVHNAIFGEGDKTGLIEAITGENNENSN